MYRSVVLFKLWRLSTRKLLKSLYLVAPIESEYNITGTFYLSSSIIITNDSFLSLLNNMTRYYPVKFPRNRVVGISDEELYGWIRAQDTISDYLISSLSFHRDLDVAEVWKLYLSKGIDVSFDTISFYDLTIDSLHRLIRVSSNSKDIESLSQRLKGTKVDRQIRKLLDSFICNPKLLCLRMRYQFWYRRYKNIKHSIE
jgi:hypothetical protein